MTSTPFVLIDDSLSGFLGGQCRLFTDPVEIVACDNPNGVADALDAIANAGARGLHAAGFMSYELGYALEPKLAGLMPPVRPVPLVWMGLFRRVRDIYWHEARGIVRAGDEKSGWDIGESRYTLDRAAYLARVSAVRDYIASGDVYQINLTFKHLFRWSGDPLFLYEELRRRQRVAHGAFIGGPGWHVLSLSPELFFETADDVIRTRPMKGTAPRGLTAKEDAALAGWLRTDEKSRAENLMIVDLLRNDLGRIAETGSVSVPALFTVESYRSVHQMTSTVKARLRAGTGIREIVEALFPCGSVTGAPKIRAMEIIRELEPEPRGVYTGAIGAIDPQGNAHFNVAIRTLLLHGDGHGEMGIGSGIVFDSDAEAEHDECLLKGRFLTAPHEPFQLIETIRWSSDEGYYLLDRHLDRLTASAERFRIPCARAWVRDGLDQVTEGLAGMYRIRLLLDEDGMLNVESAEIDAASIGRTDVRFALADQPVDSGDPHRYHKTTRRESLDDERERLAAVTGCDEVLFVNERGELTEGSYTSLFVERNGVLLTPPLPCGLLDGTLRRELLESGERRVEECLLYPADLESADAVWLGNSVRGLRRAWPVDDLEGALSDALPPESTGGGAGRP
jgi:para-aminobenzoate synthetase/4-amino-4-deoxychorismate lyase